MKMGFRLVYHKEIPKKDLKYVLEYLEAQRLQFSSKQSYKVGYTNSHSHYRQGIMGLRLLENYSYTFKRLVKNRRIFGVVPVSLLEGKNEQLRLDGCICSLHGGGQKVKLKTPFNESDWITYCELGDIKG